MNCREWEERLASYAGGDLLPPEKAAVERHLQDCAGCQLFLSGLTESLLLLREAHGDGPAPAHCAAVRERVLAELGRPRRPWYLGRWALGLATAALVVLMALWMWPAHRQPQPPPRSAEMASPPVPRPVVPSVESAPPRVRRAHVPRRRRPVPLAEPARPLVVKLVTDDPNVVIYWITETRGE